MSNIIHSLIDVRPLGTGRRIFALEKTRAIAKDEKLPGVVKRIDVALDEEQKTWRMEEAWRKSKGLPTARGDAAAIDVEIDRSFSALFANLDTQIRGLPGSRRAADATKLRDEVFPHGLQAVLQQSFEDARLYLRGLKGRFDGDLKDLLGATNTTDFAERIVELAADFEAELDQTALPEVSFDELRAARDRGNLRIKQIVVELLGAALELGPDEEKRRARLLGPILDQAARASDARKRRRVEVDIDPVTGGELDDETREVEPVEG